MSVNLNSELHDDNELEGVWTRSLLLLSASDHLL